MKIVYSELLKLLPKLTVNPSQLRDDLTLIGHFVSGFQTVENDTILDLEIRQNRADCLGYYGVARDLSVYYQTELKVDDHIAINYPDQLCDLNIKSPDVYRLLATTISHLTISSSPRWLIKLLQQHDINPINNLVDITNYVMLIFGIPCHAFDTAKTGSNLIWENNHDLYPQFQTLDGSTLNLSALNLIIHNHQLPLSLSFIGGNNSGIDQSTTEAIIEMAIYNPSRVRTDSRGLKTITQASIRLDKQLDTETIPMAFSYLIKMILNYCHGQLTTQLFDYYPQPYSPQPIDFNLKLSTDIAGINIPDDFSLNVLTRLGCQIDQQQITPPTIRKDINIAEDLAEEVIRFWGYQQIPINQPVNPAKLTDITPKVIYLVENIKDVLRSLGYDEIRSWPLVQTPLDQPTAVYTQNSINSEYPILRQSIIQSLKNQLDQYQRLSLPQTQFFEIGKIFSQKNGQYQEQYSLGIYHHTTSKLQSDIEILFQKLGLPLPQTNYQDKFVEIILDKIITPPDYSYSPPATDNQATELTRQIITLDANVSYNPPQNPQELIQKYTKLIDPHLLWSISIIDTFQNKYTFRVSYYNCDDKTAKKIHLSTFELTNMLSDKNMSPTPKSKETTRLYYQDMYLQTSSATITNIISKNNHQYLIFDQTIFFPGGGGQPADIGFITHHDQNFPLISISERDGQVLHEITPSTQLSINDQVTLQLDWNHRYQHMKIHSAGHLLHEVVMYLNNTLIPLKGYHQPPAFLTYQGLLDPSLKNKIDLEVNHLIVDNLSILCDYTTIEELRLDSRSIPINLPTNKKLRRLKIGQYPSMADGGIQVKSTKEIGQITITSIEYQNFQTKISYQVY